MLLLYHGLICCWDYLYQMRNIDGVLQVFDLVFLTVFVVEILLKWYHGFVMQAEPINYLVLVDILCMRKRSSRQFCATITNLGKGRTRSLIWNIMQSICMMQATPSWSHLKHQASRTQNYKLAQPLSESGGDLTYSTVARSKILFFRSYQGTNLYLIQMLT